MILRIPFIKLHIHQSFVKYFLKETQKMGKYPVNSFHVKIYRGEKNFINFCVYHLHNNNNNPHL